MEVSTPDFVAGDEFTAVLCTEGQGVRRCWSANLGLGSGYNEGELTRCLPVKAVGVEVLLYVGREGKWWAVEAECGAGLE